MLNTPGGHDRFFRAGGHPATDGDFANAAAGPAPFDDVRLTAIRESMTKRAGAQRIATGFARAGGAPAAGEALEALLADPRGVRQVDVGQAAAG